MTSIEPPRILIVQDREDTLELQVSKFRRVAKEYGGARIEPFDLKESHDALFDRLRDGADWYDWIVADLLEDDVDANALLSSGMNLLRRLRADGHFHGYVPRASPPRGIRCVAVYSAVFGGGGMVGREVGAELGRLGIGSDWLWPLGDVAELARRIFDALAAEGVASRGASGAAP
ncbi:MAG: hypothetical protein ACF8XB_17475 [Planctomycetota bacterium JB042]